MTVDLQFHGVLSILVFLHFFYHFFKGICYFLFVFLGVETSPKRGLLLIGKNLLLEEQIFSLTVDPD